MNLDDIKLNECETNMVINYMHLKKSKTTVLEIMHNSILLVNLTPKGRREPKRLFTNLGMVF